LLIPAVGLFTLGANTSGDSEKVTRKAIVKQLNKNPDEITNDDYKRVETLSI
jgi:hypothetical protein